MKKSIFMVLMLFVFYKAHNQTAPDSTQEKWYNLNTLPNTAFTYGEKLQYRVHYGVLNGGTANFEVGDQPVQVNNRNTYYIKVHGKSTGLVDVMFKVRDEFESYLDEQALIPWKATKKVKEGGYTDSDFIIFDHNRRVATSRRGKIEIPANTQDLISSIYYARTLDMRNAKPGDLFPVTFYLDHKNYEFRFKFLGREEIEIDAGKFKALKVRPQVIEGRVFKDSEAITMWVTDDENKIPLRVESEIWVGSLKADLIKYSGVRNPMAAKVSD
jgi:hypothetical protein